MYEAEEVMTALNRITVINNQQLDNLLGKITSGGIEGNELMRQLSMLMARGEAMEIITEELSGQRICFGCMEDQDEEEEYDEEPEADMEAAEGDVPSFIQEVENDNPEGELPDEKKLAEEQRTFMS